MLYNKNIFTLIWTSFKYSERGQFINKLINRLSGKYYIPVLLIQEWAFSYWAKIQSSYSVKSWIYTTNHKRIAVNYFNFIYISGTAGMGLATVIRLEFAYPGVGILAGDSLQYLSIATAHGVIMVFFMIMPTLFGAFGNFLLPTQLGVHDVAFPRLNSAAFWFLPGGLIMLFQLVCTDRRYQRMNSFNIRELETILKKRFFIDLVNSTDHRDLLNLTMLSARYKTNNTLSIDQNITIFYNYGTSLHNCLKVGTFQNNISTSNINLKLNYITAIYYKSNINTLIRNLIDYFIFGVFDFMYDSEWAKHLSFSLIDDLGMDITWTPLFDESFMFRFDRILYFCYDDWTFFLAEIFESNVSHFNIHALLTAHSILYVLVDVLSLNFTALILGLGLRDRYDVWSYLSTDNLDYFYTKLNTSTNSDTVGIFLNENSLNPRFLRHSNPILHYKNRYGDFSKNWEKLYPSMISSWLEITKSLIQPFWFKSPKFETLFLKNYDFYMKHFNSWNSIKVNTDSRQFHKTNPMFSYFNFFKITSDTPYLNTRWVSLDSISQKFVRMFGSNTTYIKILSNWRQLKFTREAWRCKLLISRHQKSLSKRYVNEKSVVWSLERNAKDLIPGWAMITPFSARPKYTLMGRTDVALMGVLIVLNASIVSSANFLVTYRYLSTLNNRKMRDARSFFTESLIVASWMMIAANPMLVIAIIMLLSDRHWRTSFFDYSGGGDTILFQHMFWFFGHPEVYVIMIPVFGFANTIMSYYLRKRVSARSSLMYSLYTIAFLGFFVWGHHMYMVGLAHTTRMLFSTLTVMISVPAATKLMHWCVTLVNSYFSMEIPFLWSFTFIFFFISGGVSGMCVAHTGMDVLFHDTFYVIGHFHVMLSGSAMMGIFAGFYFYLPSIYGVRYSRLYAYVHYVYYIIGQLLTVIPMLWLGYCGMPRRVLDYPSSFGGWHAISSAGHLLSVFAMLSFFIMIYDSIRQSKPTIRSNFGVGRFNTRLNFYLFEVNRLEFIQKKHFYMHRNVFVPYKSKLDFNYLTLSNLDTTLFSYRFLK